MYSIVVVDDHSLVASAVKKLVDGFAYCKVLYECPNGHELLKRLDDKKNIPDLVLLDLQMPIMDGFETTKALHAKHPDVKILGLSMNDDEDSYLKMIKSGAHGFVSKLAAEEELEEAIKSVMLTGCYYTDEMARALFLSMSKKESETSTLISDRERELLTYICTELTYQEIADKMCLSPKTIDGYRNSLFQKLNIKSRVGLAMYAVKEGYFKI